MILQKLQLAPISTNKHIPGLLAKRRMQPKSTTGYITLGALDEAIDYINNNLKPWVRTPGAIQWLSKLV